MRSVRRMVLVVCVAVFAVAVVGASSASATVPGPYFKNGAGTLGEGQTVVLKAKLKGSQAKWYVKALKEPGALIDCKAASGEGKAYNEYVKGVLKEGRLKEAKVVLEDCELEGAPECTLNGKELGEASIAFEHVLGRLGYNPAASEKEREEGKGVEELLYPETGKNYSTLKFGGAECALPKTGFPLGGEVIWTGTPVNKLATSLVMATKVESFGQELKEINFPGFTETLTEQELKFGTHAFSLEGELALTLPAGVELGVFT